MDKFDKAMVRMAAYMLGFAFLFLGFAVLWVNKEQPSDIAAAIAGGLSVNAGMLVGWIIWRLRNE